MKKYHLIDLRERSATEELKKYTFGELKAYFEPDKDDLPEYHEKWSEIKDADGLRDYLEWETDGMRVDYKIEEA